jgi:hypothetical protein
MTRCMDAKTRWSTGAGQSGSACIGFTVAVTVTVTVVGIAWLAGFEEPVVTDGPPYPSRARDVAARRWWGPLPRQAEDPAGDDVALHL